MRILWISLLMLGATAQAQENSCVLIQRLASNLGCIGSAGTFTNEKNFSDDVMTNTFGGEQCATAKVLDDAKAAQKKDCQAWLAEQKKELGARYVTGSCKPSCTPCPDTLQKCSVFGEVRYRLDNRSK